jgi:prevent-host-death family protein
MREVNADEAASDLLDLIAAAERGEEVVITDQGRTVARLVAVQARRDRPGYGSAREAFDRSGLTEADIERALAPMSDEELKEWGIL